MAGLGEWSLDPSTYHVEHGTNSTEWRFSHHDLGRNWNRKTAGQLHLVRSLCRVHPVGDR